MIIKDTGFILQLKPYSSTSAIIKLLTLKNGLITSFAKAAFSKSNSHTYQIGNLVEFNLYLRLEDNLGTITCDLIQSYLSQWMLCQSFILRTCGINIINLASMLIIHFVPEKEINPAIYNLLNDLFSNINNQILSLNGSVQDLKNIYLIFETTLFISLGYGKVQTMPTTNLLQMRSMALGSMV